MPVTNKRLVCLNGYIALSYSLIQYELISSNCASKSIVLDITTIIIEGCVFSSFYCSPLLLFHVLHLLIYSITVFLSCILLCFSFQCIELVQVFSVILA